jgi:uncharacterized protein YggE
MTKKLIALILGLFIIFTTISANAQSLNADNRPTVSVQGTSTENYPPDKAIIAFAVETSSKDVKLATKNNAITSDNIIKAVKKYIDPLKGEKIKTSNYRVVPLYDYNKNSNKNTIIGYQVTNQVTVESKQVKNTGEIIDIAIANGANRVDNLSFSLEENNKITEGLIKKATNDAYLKAQASAEALGYKVSGVKNLSVSTSRQQPYQSDNYYRAGKAAMAESVSTPIEPGDTDLNAFVQAEFYIDKK